MKTQTKRFVSLLLCFCMVLGVIPFSALATTGETESTSGAFVSETHNLFSSTSSVIAPGVTSSTNYAYSKSDGKQMVYYVATADINRDDVEIHTSYIGAQIKEYGMDKLSNQMKAANEKYQKENPYFQAVAGVNGDFYNMTTGQPTGAFYMDGEYLINGCNNRPWFAIFEDGTATCGKNTTEWNAAIAAHGKVMEAVGGSQMLVVDGKDVTATASGSYNTDRHSRSMVGVTADNKVVIVTLDGRQEPFSCGGTMHELAQIMLEQGCVIAINLDGGGSSTFITRPEGENNIKVINRPSDGSERSISSGLLIASTAIPSDIFERATLTAENEYVTPGSTVNVSAKGVSSAGTAATIPENATWAATLGTIENGVFVSDGTVGDAEISMLVDGVVVGATTIHVVLPDKLIFNQTDMIVPYSKTVALGLTATYGLNEVVIKPADIAFALGSNEIGTISGFEFSSAEEGVATTSTTLTATIVGTSVTATANLSLGKGSEVVMDFENGDLGNIGITTGYPEYGPTGQAGYNAGTDNGQNEVGHVSIVTAENGQVHDGTYALAVECDYSQPYETGYHLLNMRGFSFTAPANARTVGMWIHLPELEELYTTSMRLVGQASSGSIVNSPWLWDNCTPYGWSNDGWRYITMDISGYSEDINFYAMQLYICDRDNAANGFTFSEHASVNGRFTYYFDTFTLDYSSAVDDREPPVFADLRYADGSMSDAVSLNGQTTTDSVISFGAIVHEDTKKSNYTGLDDSSAKAYIDGVEVECTYSGGTISIADAKLSDGIHTIKFSIADKMGNSAYITRQINIASATAAPTISIVPENPTANKILIGSLYWMNLVASDIELVDEVTVAFNLNSMNQWELDHMVVADGFEATYTYDYVTNNAVITVKKVGACALTGEQKLVQIPIRTWESRLTESPFPAYANQTPEKLWSRKIIWPIDIKLSANLGSVTYTDGTTGSFSMAPISVITELYGNYAELNANGDYANKKSWHLHTETAVADVEATCTTDGCTGKTFCAVCNSVVNWGTVIPGGHKYEIVEGVLTCSGCGELLNGVHTDGKTYVDGVVVADGWSEDNRYFLNGVMYTGVQIVDGLYYDFGENGICLGRFPYNGWFTNEAGNSYLLISGVPVKQYTMIDSVPTFFDDQGIAYQGELVIGGETCVFDKGVFVESTTAEIFLAGRCGPKADFVLYADGTLYICGEGATWDYVTTGQSYLPNLSWKNRPWGNQNNPTSQMITKIVIGKHITTIGIFSFQHCYNVKAVEFEEGSKLNEIKRFAFHYLNKVTNIVLPDGVTIIGDSAFGYCKSLKTIQMPELVTSIHASAFNNSYAKLVMNVVEGSAAEEFAKTKNYTYETRAAIYGPDSIYPSDVLVAEGTCGENAKWELYKSGKLLVTGSGAIADYKQSGAPWYDYQQQITTVIVGKDITVIGKYAFAHLYSLKAVYFQEGSKLTTLNDCAFHYARKVTEIKLPETVTSIGSVALGYGAKMTYVYIPEAVTSIHNLAFLNPGANLVLDVVEGSVAEEFAKANNIAYTTRAAMYGPADILPSDVLVAEGTCGENATWKLYESGKLLVEGSGAIADYKQSGAPWYDYQQQITTVIVGKDITVIGKYAFAHLYSLKAIYFQEGSKLTTLNDYAFHYARKVTEIKLPETVTSIGSVSLGYGAKLTYVYIPEAVASIHNLAFLNPGANLVLDVAAGSVAEEFAKANNIAYTTRASVYGPADILPSDVLVAEGTCGENATWKLYESGKLLVEGSGAIADYKQSGAPWYDYQQQITTVIVGKDITVIGKYAFAHLYSLKAIYFQEGSKLTTLNDCAFHYARKVTEIKLPETVTSIGSVSLGYGAKLTYVYIPEGVTSIHSLAFLNPGANLVLDVAAGSVAESFAIANNIAYTTR